MPVSLIRAEREKRDLSLADLAAQVGMSPSMLSRLERGQRRLKVQDVLVLALALGCKPSALIPDISEPDDSQEVSHA